MYGRSPKDQEPFIQEPFLLEENAQQIWGWSGVQGQSLEGVWEPPEAENTRDLNANSEWKCNNEVTIELMSSSSLPPVICSQ